ncbi:MAG: GTPase ObgE, partial [Elusimicrobia bacterium]|nr:GTPase ObgE [Elusimicrobiota bacterium]
FGGPNGADGGKGGDVWLEASTHLTTLLELARRPHLEAERGSHGKGGNKTGLGGKDTVVPVPVGTVVYKDGALAVDLCRPGQRYLAARGGRGGRGNLSFKSRLNTAPRIYEKGAPGESTTLELELKLLADVGFVGFPNAGKSSLLARISAARPKVADYPFTTLSPNLGVCEHKGVSFVAADIPGLIEGAHAGKGLGHEFLRHVERTRVLVQLIDPAGYAGEDPVEGIKTIEHELKSFGPRLAEKPRLLAVNKMDLPGADAVYKKVRSRYNKAKPLAISVATGEGLPALLDRVLLELSRNPGTRRIDEALAEGGLVKVEKGFSVRRAAAGVYQLQGRFVERAAAMLDGTLPEAVDRFQRALKRIGVDRALRQAGIEDGDAVRCGSVEFEWSDAPHKRLPHIRRHKRTRIGVGKGGGR